MSSYFFEDLELGMEASHEKTVSEGDINSFADVSGDYNPVLMDEDYPPAHSSNPASPMAC